MNLIKEKAVHLAFCEYIKLYEKKLDLLWLHIANEGKRPPWVGAELKKMGMRPGASDFLFLKPNNDYAYLAIEVKADKASKPTLTQIEFIAHVNRSRGFGKVCHGLDECIDTFKWFYLL